MSLISIEASVTGTIGAVVGAIESVLEPSPAADVVAVATVPITSADLTGDQVAKALPGLAAIFARLAEQGPAIQAGAKIAERIARLAALFDVPGAAAAELGIELAAEDIPIVVAVGQHVLPLLTTLVSLAGSTNPNVWSGAGSPSPFRER
jgi:hypothetical protein